jgi:hypothetical protein
VVDANPLSGGAGDLIGEGRDGRNHLTVRGQEHPAVKEADANKGSVPDQGDRDC